MSDLQTSQNDGNSGRPLIVGEVLFDVFPDGTSVLGGAPLNVAWHLQALGLRPLLVTRIGADRQGRKIVALMEEWGLDTTGVQIDRFRPTGNVSVALDENRQPTFSIQPDQAYDHLDPHVDIEALLGGAPSLLYHGTLIVRSEVSRKALYAYRATTAAPVFLDINLRAPWWSEHCVARALLGARWVKLNIDEFATLSNFAGGASEREMLAAARAFKNRHALEMVIITLGAKGALVAWEDRVHKAEPPTVVSGHDTVGAGDAFSAAIVAGLLQGWGFGTTVARALDLASVVCTVPGAVSHNRETYSCLLDEWSAQQ